MKSIKSKIFTIGASVTVGLCSTLTHADNNPFSSAELSSGYMNIAAADMTGKMSEAKCGANKMKANAQKAMEAKCGANKMKENAQKAMEAKCGEAKCGANKM